MKYYLYISDTKVDMLLPQIPNEAKRKYATEFKIDLKVLSVARKAESESSDNRITRLESVCRFIMEYGDVGPVEEPASYIYDTMDLRMAANNSLVYFGGVKNKITTIGLCGSAKHLIGGNPSPNNLDEFVSSSLVHVVKGLDSLVFSITPSILEPLIVDENVPQGELDKSIQHVYLLSNYWLKGATQEIEFLAKRLLYVPMYDEDMYKPSEGKIKPMGILIAAPIYIALADTPDRLFTRRG